MNALSCAIAGAVRWLRWCHVYRLPRYVVRAHRFPNGASIVPPCMEILFLFYQQYTHSTGRFIVDAQDYFTVADVAVLDEQQKGPGALQSKSQNMRHPHSPNLDLCSGLRGSTGVLINTVRSANHDHPS